MPDRIVVVGLAVVLVFAVTAKTGAIIDLDLWHQLSLARDILTYGSVPVADHYAYTPTVQVIQHEWGAGVIAHAVLSACGWPGIMLLNLALAACALVLALTRANGTTPTLIAFIGLATIPLISRGYPPIRAQAYSFLLFVALLVSIELHKRGNRRWLWAGGVPFVVWVNLHASFILAFVVLGLYWLCRPRLTGVLILLAAMAALVSINPYGWAHYEKTLNGVLMPRPGIDEWAPAWSSDVLSTVCVSAMALFPLLLYATARRRFDMHALAVLVAFGVAACLHAKLIPYFGFAVLVYLPAGLTRTRLASEVAEITAENPRTLTTVWAALVVASMIGALTLTFWRARIPENGPSLHYPVRAVRFLSESGFRGNLMTPFDQGAYVSYHLHPLVHVSMDSRYEVAYPVGVFSQNMKAYAGFDWKEYADRYRADAILAPTRGRLDAALMLATGWYLYYRDDSFVIYRRNSKISAN